MKFQMLARVRGPPVAIMIKEPGGWKADFVTERVFKSVMIGEVVQPLSFTFNNDAAELTPRKRRRSSP
jgi:hypothetical protein